MKPTTKLIFTMGIIAFAACPYSGFAQSQGAGNGGDALLCEGQTPVVLDSYEAKQIYKKEADLQADDSYFTSVQAVINRITDKDLMRGTILQNYWNELKVELPLAEAGVASKIVRFQTDKLPEVDDEMVLQIPKDCHLQQLVIQVSDHFNSHDAWDEAFSKYSIQKQLWDQFDNIQKTITLTHELWYRYFLSVGATFSRNARALNALFFTNHHLDFSFRDYMDLLARTEIPHSAEFPGTIPVAFKTPFGIVEAKNLYQTCGLLKDEFGWVPGTNLIRATKGIWNIQPSTAQEGTICFALSKGARFQLSRKFGAKADSIFIDQKTGTPILYRLRRVTGLGVQHGSGPHKFNFNGIKVHSKNSTPLEADFFGDGTLRSITGRSAGKVKLKNKTRIKNPDHDLNFDKDGNLITP